MGYYSFPGMAPLLGDDLIVVARGAGNEVSGGLLFKVTSSDNGATWSGATTIRDNSKDIRDAGLLRLANGDLLCTFTERSEVEQIDFKAYTMISDDEGVTWQTAVQMVPTDITSWQFVTGNPIQLPGGDILVAVYGCDTASISGTDNIYSVLMKSTDGGVSWAQESVIVAEGTLSRNWEEPQITRDPNTGTIFCALRSDTGTDTIYMVTSDDDGATWSAPTALFAGSGRPSIYWTADDALAIMYRYTPSGGRSVARFSFDSGASWDAPYFFNSGGLFSYGCWLDLTDGTLGAVWCVEQSSTRSDMTFDVFEYSP